MAYKWVDETKLDAALGATADAIREKTGDTAQINFDMENETGFESAIEEIESGGETPEEPERDVNFIDWDGRIVYSYTAQEFLLLDTMPANPSHEGLIARGWNWSLQNAQREISGSTGKYLCIGQQYELVDEGLHIYGDFEVPSTVRLCFYMSGTATIDWGDRSQPITMSGTNSNVASYSQSHELTGAYHIIVRPSDVSTKISIGGDLPNNEYNGSSLLVDASNNKPNNAIRNSITSLMLPKNIQGALFHASGCRRLKSVLHEYGSKHMLRYSYFYTGLHGIVIPEGSDKGDFTESSFGNCYSLRYISYPQGFGIGGLYGGIKTPREKVHIPIDATSIPNGAFNGSIGIEEIAMPHGITEIQRTGLYQMYSLTELTIPSGVTIIGASGIRDVLSLKKLTFLSVVPPVAIDSTSINIPNSCEIHVPQGALNAYKTATNYPNPSTYTYVEDL